VINQYETRKAEMNSKMTSLETENSEKRRMEADINELRKTLDNLEISFERERTALMVKERELDVLRSECLSRSRERYGSIAELEKRLKHLHETGGKLQETDILGDVSFGCINVKKCQVSKLL